MGAKALRRDGYVRVKTKHGWVLEHRLVAAEVMGRPLMTNELVHHLDGNKTNNAPDNLRVVTSEEHWDITRPHQNSPVVKPRHAA